jgi:hypothetical protein
MEKDVSHNCIYQCQDSFETKLLIHAMILKGASNIEYGNIVERQQEHRKQEHVIMNMFSMLFLMLLFPKFQFFMFPYLMLLAPFKIIALINNFVSKLSRH